MKKYVSVFICAALLVGELAFTGCSKAAKTGSGKNENIPDYGFPAGTVTWVVPGKAGGGSDLAIRYYSEAMTKELGITNTVTNCSSNTIAHSTIANAKPDGSQIMLATAALNIQFITGNADVDPKKDLTLIAAMQDNGFSALCAPSKAPYNNFDEMIQYAKANPGKLNAGQPNSGNNTFQFGMIEKETGVDFNAVECSAESERLVNLAGGFIDLGFCGMKNAMEYERAGKFKVIATIAADGKSIAEFDASLPANYKTMQEQGYSKCYWNVQHFVYGPAGMDSAQVEKINKTLKLLYENEACRMGIAGLGQLPEWHDVAESVKIRDAEYEAEVTVAKFLGMMK